jgi:hypothetical protein
VTCLDFEDDVINVNEVPQLPPELRITVTDLFAISRMSGVDSRVFVESALGFFEDVGGGNL